MNDAVILEEKVHTQAPAARRTNNLRRRPTRTRSKRRLSACGTAKIAQLKVAYGKNLGHQVQCWADQPTVMGRHSRCDLRLLDPRISRWHAALTVDNEGRWVVTDLKSENGTHVNGSPIDQPYVLSNNDLIRIGSTLINVML
jgi:hypothetical protein